MKTRCAGLILALLLTLSPCAPVTARAEGPVEISDAAGLIAMAEDPAGSYRLTADIDLNGVEWTPFAFSGELDGGGHALLNLRVETLGEGTCRVVDGNNKVYEAASAGMFSRLEGAKIHDLTLLGTTVEVSAEGHCFAGALAGWMEDAEIRNVSAVTSVSLRQGGIMSGVGGLVGYGSGEIRDTGIWTKLVFIDENPERNCEEFAGGMVGCGHPSILNSTVGWAELWPTAHGYCHNGCLVGMHHVDVSGKVYTTVTGNTVSGRIHFLEDVGSRRAYADAVIGEKLNPRATVKENTVVDFDTEEFKELPESVPYLAPCLHERANYENEVTEPTCTDFGHTLATCPECGYAEMVDYTLPRHSPGEWETVKEATLTEAGLQQQRCTLCGELLEERELAPHVPGEWEIVKEATLTESGLKQQRCTDCGEVLAEEPIAPHVPGEWETEREPDESAEGLRVRRCTDCGEILEEEILPRIVPVRTLVFGEGDLILYYKESFTPSVLVMPRDATDPTLLFESLDEGILRVSPEGRVTAVGRGETELRCASSDGGAEARCRVEVRYHWWQWLIVVFLFGWIWY